MKDGGSVYHDFFSPVYPRRGRRGKVATEKGSSKRQMPRHYVFKSATFTGQAGRAHSLDRVDAEYSGTSRRPLRLKLSVRGRGPKTVESVVATVEMTQREAFAFSEWLDAVATDPKGSG
jgi:hypothetical protein